MRQELHVEWIGADLLVVGELTFVDDRTSLLARTVKGALASRSIVFDVLSGVGAGQAEGVYSRDLTARFAHDLKRSTHAADLLRDPLQRLRPKPLIESGGMNLMDRG